MRLIPLPFTWRIAVTASQPCIGFCKRNQLQRGSTFFLSKCTSVTQIFFVVKINLLTKYIHLIRWFNIQYARIFWELRSSTSNEQNVREYYMLNHRIERVSIECRKTKTKVITLANQKGRRQYSKPIKTRSNYT